MLEGSMTETEERDRRAALERLTDSELIAEWYGDDWRHDAIDDIIEDEKEQDEEELLEIEPQ
jgi:hypothetical protein